MGRRGPKRESGETKRTRGTARADRETVTLAEIREPVAPSWLDENGREEFAELAQRLVDEHLATDLDSHILALFLNTLEDYKTARREVEQYGLTCISDKGGVYQHPAVGIMNAAIKTLRTLARELGLSPSSRAGLLQSMLPPDDEDPLTEAERARGSKAQR